MPGTLEETIGFIGGGKMALAMGKGFVSSGIVDPSRVSWLTSIKNQLRGK